MSRHAPPTLCSVGSAGSAPVVQASGGGTFWVGPGTLPDIRRVAPDRGAAGRNWIGFRANGDYVVTGVSDIPLLPGLAALLLGLGTLIAAVPALRPTVPR